MKIADIYNKAGGGAAAVALGGVVPVVGATTSNCPGGGSVAYSGPATGMTATYNACVVGQHTFGGNATVSYVASGSTVQSYIVDYSSLNVERAGRLQRGPGRPHQLRLGERLDAVRRRLPQRALGRGLPLRLRGGRRQRFHRLRMRPAQAS